MRLTKPQIIWKIVLRKGMLGGLRGMFWILPLWLFFKLMSMLFLLSDLHKVKDMEFYFWTQLLLFCGNFYVDVTSTTNISHVEDNIF